MFPQASIATQIEIKFTDLISFYFSDKIQPTWGLYSNLSFIPNFTIVN